jgi:hypothetical protein
MQHLFLLALLLLVAQSISYRVVTTTRAPNTVLRSTREGFGYLSDPSQSIYLQNILLRAVDNTKVLMNQPDSRLIEVMFPETRKNDPSVTQSLDINRAFSFEFAERMQKAFEFEKDAFWLLFPDEGEADLGMESVREFSRL